MYTSSEYNEKKFNFNFKKLFFLYNLSLCGEGVKWWSATEMDVTFIFIAQSVKSAMVKWKMPLGQQQQHYTANRTSSLCKKSAKKESYWRLENDDKTECMPTLAQQPRAWSSTPNKLINSQATVCVSTGSCFYSRLTVMIALKSLWPGFHLCFVLLVLCSFIKTKSKIICVSSFG